MSFLSFWELCIMLQNWLYLPKAFAIIYTFEKNLNNYEAVQRASVVLVFDGS